MRDAAVVINPGEVGKVLDGGARLAVCSPSEVF